MVRKKKDKKEKRVGPGLTCMVVRGKEKKRKSNKKIN